MSLGPEITPYAVTKSALRTLMRGMARELAPRCIRVNAIAPGIASASAWQNGSGTADPDYRRRAEKAIPLGNLQDSPMSVANVTLVFLASDASEYMTNAASPLVNAMPARSNPSGLKRSGVQLSSRPLPASADTVKAF